MSAALTERRKADREQMAAMVEERGARVMKRLAPDYPHPAELAFMAIVMAALGFLLATGGHW